MHFVGSVSVVSVCSLSDLMKWLFPISRRCAYQKAVQHSLPNEYSPYWPLQPSTSRGFPRRDSPAWLLDLWRSSGEFWGLHFFGFHNLVTVFCWWIYAFEGHIENLPLQPKDTQASPFVYWSKLRTLLAFLSPAEKSVPSMLGDCCSILIHVVDKTTY